MRGSAIRFIFYLVIFCCSSSSWLWADASRESEKKIVIFAAASLRDVLPKVGLAWKKENHKEENQNDEIIFSFDGSSKLAKQIYEGAPADLYFSAHDLWMNDLDAKSLLEPETRAVFLTNQLVLASASETSLKNDSELTQYLKTISKFAVAGESVPAGIYAKEALEKLGVWPNLEKKLLRGLHVKTVAKWLLDKHVPAGIIYASDVQSSNGKLHIIWTFPIDSYSPIHYPLAVLKSSKNKQAAKSFIDFCQSAQALNLFRKAGFKVVKKID